MSDIKFTIEPDDIEWEMDWTGIKEDGTRRYPDKPDKELVFEEEGALAILLLNEVIFLNTYHWEKSWPEEAKNTIYLGVDCSDVFAWGCSDSEAAHYKDIETLYRMWKKDTRWGAAIWCMIQRKQMPQSPVEKKIREEGLWDLDALKREHGLRNNHYSGISTVYAQMKYEAYAEWMRLLGKEPLNFSPSWWEGWREYKSAHPSWYNEGWKEKEALLKENWKIENGYK